MRIGSDQEHQMERNGKSGMAQDGAEALRTSANARDRSGVSGSATQLIAEPSQPIAGSDQSSPLDAWASAIE